jgi:hypothetical protein
MERIFYYFAGHNNVKRIGMQEKSHGFQGSKVLGSGFPFRFQVSAPNNLGIANSGI